jgi:hypothetical protein
MKRLTLILALACAGCTEDPSKALEVSKAPTVDTWDPFTLNPLPFCITYRPGWKMASVIGTEIPFGYAPGRYCTQVDIVTPEGKGKAGSYTNIPARSRSKCFFGCPVPDFLSPWPALRIITPG